MEGTGPRNSVVDIHLELGPFGYKMTRGDIVRFFPLNNQAKKESKIPTVVIYKSREITSKVTEAAKAAGLWGRRAAKSDDRPGARNGYFRAPANIRRKFTPRKNHRNQETQPKGDQSRQTSHGNPQPSGDRSHNVEDGSTASSVEITDVIYNITGTPVTGALPKSPLELGLVPPYTGSESPPNEFGEDQNPGEEPPSRLAQDDTPEPDAESGVRSRVKRLWRKSCRQ